MASNTQRLARFADGVARLGDNFNTRRAAILPLIGDTGAEWNKGSMAYVAPTWRIGFTGRTQRQAIQDGELPRLGQPQ